MPIKRTLSQNAGQVIRRLRSEWDDDIDALLSSGLTQKRVDSALDKLAIGYEKQIEPYRRILHEAEHGKVEAV